MPWVESKKGEYYPPVMITEAQQQAAFAEIRERQAASDDLAAKILVGLVFVVVAVGFALYRRRQAIAAAADRALIGGSAGAVKGARAARNGWARFRDRVLERADRAK